MRQTDTYLRAGRVDRDAGDLFALQNEITSQIAVALHVELVCAESPGAARTAAVRGGHFRIRDGTRVQSQLGTRNSDSGILQIHNRSIEEAIPARERAIRLSPRDPRVWQYYYWIGQVHLLESRSDEAILWFEEARSTNPEHPLPHAYLASCPWPRRPHRPGRRLTRPGSPTGQR